MGLGLITLFFLGCFTFLYVGRSLDEKPPFVLRGVERIEVSLGQLGFWGLVFGLVALVLTPGFVPGSNFKLIVFLSNVTLALAALPRALETVLKKWPDKFSEGLTKDLRALAAAIEAREKYVGYAGAFFCFFLFISLLR